VIVYLDTSAYVKLVLEEVDSRQVRGWFASATRAVSSVITYAETCAAFSRRDRDVHTTASRLTTWAASLDDRWRRTVSVPVDGRSAGRLAIAHGLRGMDAVQLAAALTLRERVLTEASDAEVAFAAFDRRLLEAAEREGLTTLGRPLE